MPDVWSVGHPITDTYLTIAFTKMAVSRMFLPPPCIFFCGHPWPDIRYPANLLSDSSRVANNEIKKKIIKKFPNARAGQTAGRMHIFFCSSPIFSGKIVDLRSVNLLYFCSSMLCGGNLDPHFSKRGDCVKKVEDR